MVTGGGGVGARGGFKTKGFRPVDLIQSGRFILAFLSFVPSHHMSVLSDCQLTFYIRVYPIIHYCDPHHFLSGLGETGIWSLEEKKDRFRSRKEQIGGGM